MKHLWWRTLLAMVGGIGMFAFGFALVVGISEGTPDWGDLLTFAFYLGFVTAYLALPAWLISVLPMTFSGRGRRLLTHRVWMECIWATIGLLTFGIILAIARDIPPLLTLLMPTLVGGLAGFAMRLVLRCSPLLRKEAR